MNKDEKAKIVSNITELVKKSNSMLFTDFTGLTVEQVTELRKEFRNSNIGYRVSKNTLIKRALQDMENSDKVFPYLKGPTGIVFGYEDPLEPIKIIKKFIDKNNKPSVKVVYLEKNIYDGSELETLAKLPSKKEIIASILGSISAPLSGVPNVVQSVIGGLINVIEEVAKKNEENKN